jgi:hypothetical protein
VRTRAAGTGWLGLREGIRMDVHDPCDRRGKGGSADKASNETLRRDPHVVFLTQVPFCWFSLPTTSLIEVIAIAE